jgi:hypothetical protein
VATSRVYAVTLPGGAQEGVIGCVSLDDVAKGGEGWGGTLGLYFDPACQGQGASPLLPTVPLLVVTLAGRCAGYAAEAVARVLQAAFTPPLSPPFSPHPSPHPGPHPSSHPQPNWVLQAAFVGGFHSVRSAHWLENKASCKLHNRLGFKSYGVRATREARPSPTPPRPPPAWPALTWRDAPISVALA